MPKLWPRFTDPRHLAPLDDVLTRATRDGHVRAVVSAPVRHGKSTLLEAAAVRHLALRPGSWVMWASHSAELADAKSREIRDAAVRAGLSIRRDSARLSRWELTGGGGFIAAGVGSSAITGQGAGLLCADDLLGSRSEAESKTARDSIDAWWSGTFATRATPDASLILTGARFHLDDQHARLIERGGFEVINLPAISEDGRALWPEGGWTVEKLDEKRREIGNYDFSSLYQGSPTVRGETLFAEPRSFTRSELVDALADDARLVLALDPAAGLRERNDYSAAVIVAIRGRGPTAEGFITHAWRGRLALPDLVKQVVQLTREHGVSLCVVEGVAGFLGVSQAIRAIAGASLKVHVPHLVGDKLVRAAPVAAAIADGRVRIPDSRPPWCRWLVDELLSFPVGVHDDCVDACSLAFNIAAHSSGRTRRELAEIDARIHRGFPLG